MSKRETSGTDTNVDTSSDAGRNESSGSVAATDGSGNRLSPLFSRAGSGRIALFGLGFLVGASTVWLIDLAIPEGQRPSVDIAIPEVTEDPTVAAAPAIEEVIPEPLPAIPGSISVASLETKFEGLGYDLTQIRANQAEVPRVLPEAVPHDLPDVQEVERKKALFLRMVLPLVLTTNERLMEQRARIIELTAQQAAGKTLSAEDGSWLAAMYEAYKTEPGNTGALLQKVDVVPPSLALAQAAVESGWGTSRFAREGNALFGQWVWGDAAKGIVPESREAGKTHKIKAFDTPLEAVAAYIKNLNTHRAYRKLRDIRAELRAQGARLNGAHMAEGLEAYSEKGMEYVNLIRGIISSNKLRPLDRARLANAKVSDSNA